MQPEVAPEFKPSKQRPISLALRLTLLFGIVSVIVFTGFGWLIENSIKRHFVNEDVKELESIVQAVQLAIRNIPASDTPLNNDTSLMLRFNDILIGHHGALLYIADSKQRVIYASPGPDLSPLAKPSSPINIGRVTEWRSLDPIPASIPAPNREHHLRVLRHNAAPDANDAPYGAQNNRAPRFAVIVAALPIDFHLAFLETFRLTLWLMIALGLGITGLMSWLAARYGLAPVHRIVNQIRHIHVNDLNTRLSPNDVPRELTDLATSFNEMLERLQQAFVRLSDFSGDIAHDLRTPVTSMMTQTQVALSQPRSIEEYQEILYSNIEEYEHMAQMINDMLYLAKADNSQGHLNVTDVNLTEQATALFEYYEAWAEESDVTLELQGKANAQGDPIMLRRAMANLLSNAIRHTMAGGSVKIALQNTPDGLACIEVENPGKDIPTKHLPRLFERFYRVDPARHEGGTGLGLAIVKSIVDAHQGQIRIESLEGVTRFLILLPK